MDFDYLENVLESIQFKIDRIHTIGEYCLINNVNNQMEIAKIIEKHFNKHKDPKARTAIFLVCSEIFHLAIQRKNRNFFKHLSQRAKAFLEQLNNEILENQELAVAVTSTIDKWSAEQIFAPVFIERLKETARAIYKSVAENKNKNDRFSKYNKTFLLELRDVRSFPPTCQFYDTYVQWQELNTKITSFQQAFTRLDLENPTQETKIRAREMLRACEEYRERLVSVIEGTHLTHKLLTQFCQVEFARLGEDNSA